MNFVILYHPKYNRINLEEMGKVQFVLFYNWIYVNYIKKRVKVNMFSRKISTPISKRVWAILGISIFL